MRERLRVLMLGWEFPPMLTGGLGVACEGLSRALVEHVDLDLWLPSHGNLDGPEAGTRVPVRLMPYEGVKGVYAGDLQQRVSHYSEWVTDHVDFVRYDVIHAHDWMTIPAAWALRRKTGLPVILHLHSLEYDRAGSRQSDWIHMLEQTGIWMADRVIAVSGYTAAICRSEYGADDGKLRVVHNGAWPTHSWRVSGHSPKLVFVGRMTAQKRPDLFIEMAAEVAAQVEDAQFVMIGEGELLGPVRKLAGQLGLGDRLRFTGFLARPQMRAEFSTASLLCMPSSSEPFGLVALEAAQFSVPAVVTPNCGVREVLGSAVVVDEGDSMARAVVELLNDPQRMDRLGRQAREEAGRATWTRAARQVVDVYRELQVFK